MSVDASPQNIEDTRKFLNLLAPSEEVVFQVFDDKQKGPRFDAKEQEARRKRLTRVLSGSLDEHVSDLRAFNDEGAGVYVTVNHSSTGRRKKADIDRVRAVFVDLDGAPLEPILEFALKPHIVIETSPGRFHAYWLVEHLSLDEFSLFQKALAARFNGDTSVNDLPRVMRLPGFLHQKEEPAFLSHILEVNDCNRYLREHLVEALGYDPAQTTQEERSELWLNLGDDGLRKAAYRGG